MYCLRVNVYCHRVTTQLQLTNISHTKNKCFYGGLFGHKKQKVIRKWGERKMCISILCIFAINEIKGGGRWSNGRGIE